MNREKQLLKNTGILALGKICTQFVSFFLLPLYTSYLSTAEYGIVDLLNNYITLLIPIFFFQMEQALFRFLIDVRNDEKKKCETISTAIITVTSQVFVFIIFFIIFSKFFNNEYKYFMLLNVVFTMYANILLQMCRGLGNNITYSLGSLISGVSTIILNIFFIAILKMGAYGMLTATLVSNILCIIFITCKQNLFKIIRFKNYNNELRKKLWKYSVPLIPNQLSWWIVNVSDRTLITFFINISANGIYSAANKFSAICITFFNFFNMTWSESASMHIKDGDSDVFFSKVLNTSLKIFSGLCFMIVSIMPFVFEYLITGKEYADAYYQIPLLMLATIFNILVSLLGSIYVALKKSNEIAKTSIFAAIINILINIIFIKYIGLYAASISTLVAYFSMAVYRYFDIQKYVKIKIDKKIITYIVVSTICSIGTYYLRKNIMSFISFIFIFVISLIINKEIIFSLLKIVKIKIRKIKND